MVYESIENVSNFKLINHKFNFWRITKRNNMKNSKEYEVFKKSSEEYEDFGTEKDMP